MFSLSDLGLLTENFYRIVPWMIEYIRWKHKKTSDPYPTGRFPFSTRLQQGILEIFQKEDPGLKTYDLRFSLRLPDETVYRLFFYRSDEGWVISGADTSDPIMDRAYPGEEFGGWFPEELMSALGEINKSIDPARCLKVKNLIESAGH